MTRTTFFTLMLTFVVAGLLACGGGDTPDHRGTTSAKLSLPGLTPIPFDPNVKKPSWQGSPVELMFADALASCSYDPPTNHAIFAVQYRGDEYVRHIQQQMDNATCQYVNSSGVTVTYLAGFKRPELRWLDIRNDPKCNRLPVVGDPANGAEKAVGLDRRTLNFNINAEAPFASSQANIVTAGAATWAVKTPLANLCIAQQLRRRAPGASGGEALLLSGADQRQLLALIKDRAQVAMLQLALLGRVFSTAPVANPGAVSFFSSNEPTNNGYPLSFLPVLQQWAQGGAATTDPSGDLLKTLGDELATAVRLHITVSQELAELLSRSGSARLPRGGSVLDPAWGGRGGVDTWGPGSWRQRALASLFGGDPLVEDEGGSPWNHFFDKKEPGDTGMSLWTNWPDVGDAAFVSTKLTDPKISRLFTLARGADALYLQKDAAWSALPKSRYECHKVVRDASAERLYRATEAAIRTQECSSFTAATNTCKSFVLNEIPSTQDFATFDLWKKYRISPDHATVLVSWLDEITAKECQGTKVDFSSGVGIPGLSNVAIEGPLDFSGSIELTTVSGVPYYHLVNYEPKPHVLRETVGLFSRYSAFQMPYRIWPEADPSTQGFDLGSVILAEIQSGPIPQPSRSHEEMRLMGAVSALTATRDALIESARDITSLSPTVQPRVNAFFARNATIVSMIDSSVGRSGVSIIPQLSTSAADLVIRVVGNQTLHRSVVKPHNTQRIVDVAIDSADPFWYATGCPAEGCQSGAYVLYAIPNFPMATSLAAHERSTAFFQTAAGSTVNANILYATTQPAAVSVSQPTSILRCNAALGASCPDGVTNTVIKRRFEPISMHASDEQYSLVVLRALANEPTAYLPLASHITTFSPEVGGQAQYLSFNGTLSNFGARVNAAEMANPAEPAFDGFGLPTTWLPPTDPALFGGAVGDDAIASYLRKARVSADEATAAVKDAFDEMLKTQEDEAALAVSVSKAEKVAEIERSALCGSATCDASMVATAISAETIWNSAPQRLPAGRPQWSTLRSLGSTMCKPNVGETVSQFLARVPPSTRLDCLATSILDTVDVTVRVLKAVADRRSAPTVPSFNQFAGGTLESIAIEQWTAIRSLEDSMRAFIAATDAAIAHVELFQNEFNALSDQEREMRKRCEHLQEVLANAMCRDPELFPDRPFKCPTKRVQFDELDWGDEISPSQGHGGGVSRSVSAGFAGFGASTTDSSSQSSSASDMSLGAKRRLCESYRTSVSSSAWRLEEAIIQAYANVQERAVEFTEAMGRVRLSTATARQAKHQTDLAIARSNLEVDLLRSSQKTSFGLYRQLHSYDAWRAKALLEGSRISAAIARKAIESRYLVDLSTLTQPEPLVAGPSSWADEVYQYDLDMPSAVGLTVGEPVPSGIYANRMLDYVGNLERFVNGYSIARPTTIMRNDTELISLPGPKGLDTGRLPGTTLPDGRAYAWTYFCPDGGNGAWRPSPPNMKPSEACGPPPLRPTRAALIFTLDPWGRVHGDIAAEPFDSRFNARWENLAINLVGTGVLDCLKAQDADGCYTQPFIRYRLNHRGPSWVTDASQSWLTLPVPTGRIEGAKALAAEQWLDPIVNAWSKPFVSSVQRGEFASRPLAGSYEVEFQLGPEVVLERIERVQLLAATSYWVKQGFDGGPPQGEPEKPAAPLNPEWAGLTPLVDWNPAIAVTIGSSPVKVASVPNATGSNRTLVGTVGHEPEFTPSNASFNNQPTLSFPVGNQPRATFGDLGIPNNGPCSIIIVNKTPRTGTNSYMFSLTNQQAAFFKSIGTNVLHSWLSTDFNMIASNNDGTNPSIMLATLGGGTQRLYVNSVTEETSTGSTGVVFSGGGMIGDYAPLQSGSNDSYTFGGDIARVLIFGSVLDATQRAACMNALGAKYGITIN